MGEITLTKFIIGMLFIGLIATGFGLLLGSFNTEYQRDDYDNSTLTKFSNMSAELAPIVRDTENKTNAELNDDDRNDILGAFFKGGYTAVRTTKASIDNFEGLLTEGAEQSGIPYIQVITNHLFLIMFTVLVIGILVAIVVKSNRV